MTSIYRCRKAASASACPEKTALLLIHYHLELIQSAGEAYRRVLTTRSTRDAHRAWLNAAESLTVAIILQAERENSHD